MKLLVFITLLLASSVATADLAQCKSYLKSVTKTCNAGMNATKCIVDTMEVSGLEVMSTGTQVYCKGEHNLAVKKASKKKSDSKEVVYKSKKRAFDFGD